MRGRAQNDRGGLSKREAAILDLWDSGVFDIDEIAERTGLARRFVRDTVSRFGVTNRSLNEFDVMCALGSEALLAAIERHHPEMVR